MEPPFPGMDPYLERSSLWPDVHHRIISAICDYLQARIAPGYIAQITPYVALEQIEIAAPRRALVPDVGVYERDPAAVAVLPAAVDAPSLTGAALLDVPTRYARVELRAVADETLVTAIELLSPANKRPTPDGADAYEQKRQACFAAASICSKSTCCAAVGVRAWRAPTRSLRALLRLPQSRRTLARRRYLGLPARPTAAHRSRAAASPRPGYAAAAHPTAAPGVSQCALRSADRLPPTAAASRPDAGRSRLARCPSARPRIASVVLSILPASDRNVAQRLDSRCHHAYTPYRSVGALR